MPLSSSSHARPTTPAAFRGPARLSHAAASYDRFRDAAEALGITESAVSHQVRRLEEFLHVALFDRTSGGARLTPAGQRYLEEIDPAIRRIEEATEAMRAVMAERSCGWRCPPRSP